VLWTAEDRLLRSNGKLDNTQDIAAYGIPQKSGKKEAKTIVIEVLLWMLSGHM